MRKRSELKRAIDPDDEVHPDGKGESTESGPHEPAAAERVERPRTYNFKTANTRREEHMRDDIANVVETLWLNDVEPILREIRDSFYLGTRRSEHGFLVQKLDRARQLQYEAHRVYVTAKREIDRWELENSVVFSAMWRKASHELETEKGEKTRSKPITDTDVRAKVMALFPDQYIDQEHKRNATKLTMENISHVVKVAGEKAEDLRVMLAKLRG